MKRNVPKEKILIVEDEDILCGMYKEVFEKEGFEAAIAKNGQEAIQVAERIKPDVILLDILLPKEDGIYFLEKRQTIPSISSIPVIGFSNFDDPRVRRDAFRLGVRDYLLKTNYTPQEVVRKVRDVLQSTNGADSYLGNSSREG